MKTYKILGGLFVTAALVSAGSVFTGAQAKLNQQKKKLLEAKSSMSSIHFHHNTNPATENNSEIKQVTFGVDKTYKNALEAFEIKTQYERFQLLTLKTLKNPAEESFKALKAVKAK